MTHLVDNGHDRDLGAEWERRFCRMADKLGMALTPSQLPRPNGAASWYRGGARLLLPDVVIWSAPGEHHEIKHKDATQFGCYGLEAYRLDALVAFAAETCQPVLYTIHDWRRAGAASSDEEMPNRLEDWWTVDVLELAAEAGRQRARSMPTWRNGRRDVVTGYYWPTGLWAPLADWWGHNW